MAVFRNPIARHKFLPINKNSGDMEKDVIIINTSTRLIRDLELPSQLTQLPKTHGFVPRTREDAYRDITLVNPKIVGRMERDRSPYRSERYSEPRI